MEVKYDRLEPVIGLEIHVQLKTRTKLFSSSDNHAHGASPNELINAIDVGHPGTLPSLNSEALHFAVRVGLALNCRINSPVFFDRKHYLYPDLPKGYQISQFDVPVAEDGFLEFATNNGDKPVARIEIERAHLEEDAAKNVHRDGKTLVDFNRAGTPLVEIVTRPDFRSAREAKLFLQELRRIMRYIGVSDADMEKGNLRCDANISLRPVDKDGMATGDLLYPKTEVKNMNSFKAVSRAIEYEISRQSRLWSENDAPTVTTTRGWNDATLTTELQRVKEEAADYRFMREPDIPPVALSDIVIEEKASLPELPAMRRERFAEEYGFRVEDIWMLTDDPAIADYVEATISELYSWLRSLPDIDGTDDEVQAKYKKTVAKLVSTWIGTKLMGVTAGQSIDIRVLKVTPEDMAELMTLVFERKLNNTSALKVLERMVENGDSPAHIMADLGLKAIDSEDELVGIIEEVISENPDKVQAYMNGKEALLQFFIGMVLKATNGNADPKMAASILKKMLK